MLQGAFWRPSNSSVSTLHLRSDISNSHSRNTLCLSQYWETPQPIYEGWCCSIIFLAHHGFHKVNLGQSPYVRACPPSRQAQTLQFFWLPIQQHAPSKPSPWPQLALGHRGIRSQLLHPQTNVPWPRCPKPDPREQKGSKEAFGNASQVLMSSAV